MRKINSAGQYNESHADTHDNVYGGLAENLHQIVRAPEGTGRHSEEYKKQSQRQQGTNAIYTLDFIPGFFDLFNLLPS
ncbi:hypothetical protein [Agathobaculum butyriciproducens]|uniref:hypothetical protein n=1 Tax=Agathobaculum butyriciproducens TaxID=1628085 RepID=UPI003AAD6162